MWTYVVTGESIVVDENTDVTGDSDGDSDGDDGGLGAWGLVGISLGGLALIGLLIFLIMKWLGKGNTSSKGADGKGSKPKTETDSLITNKVVVP